MSDAQQIPDPSRHSELRPPRTEVGIFGWVYHNLLSTPFNAAMTILALWFLWSILPPFIEWILLDAVWSAESRKECWEKMEVLDGHGTAACWAFIANRIELFVYGFYPAESRWRVNLSFILLIAAIVPVLYDKMPGRKLGLCFVVAFPFITGWLLVGGLGLAPIDTDQFGGIMLTLVIGVTGISCSLPIGVLLALGRRSKMPVLRILCVLFIEFIRGVPLIALLFFASTMLNYLMPPGTVFSLLIRVLIIVTLFAAGYIAEVGRGGLQGIPKGQFEAAESLGMNYFKVHWLIVLPQALKISFPGIVNTFIGLFKDTTLVLIIGMLDPLGVGRASLADAEWAGLAREVYLFVALFFFICCFFFGHVSSLSCNPH